MRRRLILLGAGLALALAPFVAARASAPLPEPNFAGTVLPRPCTVDPGNVYEARQAAAEGWQGPEYERYPGACQRLRFAFGPIVVKPGQNDVLVQPITVEKPAQDGYITRFRPDLVRTDGTVPPIEQIHLHHGTWLSVPQDYGIGPFFAAGEEKTIASYPRGYGMPVKASDQWQMLYMIHSAVPQPQVVYITYDVDFIPAAAAKAPGVGLRPAYPVWLDVRPSTGYPVFNVQRGNGTGSTCTWPAQKCAAFDPYGKVITGQGAPGNQRGTDLVLPARGANFGRSPTGFTGGTLIGIGGHLHPGGLTNDIDVVRGSRARRIYTGEANYWDHGDHSKLGGPANSWDFSMTVTGLPRWGVHVQPGDALRSNATYDTSLQSTYEDMGIAVAILAPDDVQGRPTAPGVDPFTAPGDTSPTCGSGGLAAKPTPTLCDKGILSHGHLKENDHYGGESPSALPSKLGSAASQVAIGAFLFQPGDLSMVAMTGIPTVKLGSKLQFNNADTWIDVYHTVTSCSYPCTGATGTSFPIANGRTSAGRQLDFDSGELGLGLPGVSAAKNELAWSLPVTAAAGFKPGEVVTYYCRIHPGMRGAFEVSP
jgi:hypothetical protein